MKFISTTSIDPKDFKKRPFAIYDSIENIVKNQANANNFYILEVEEEENPINVFLFKTGVSKKGKFINHRVDSTGKIIKILRKVSLKEINEAGASISYFYNYAINNAFKLKGNSLNIIIKYLINKNIEPELLISFCAKVKKLDRNGIAMIEDYIFSKIININMIVEFANKVPNCSFDKLMSYVLEYYSDDDSLILFVNSVDGCNMDSVIEYLIKKDSCPNLSNSMKCLKAITNLNFDFSIVEDEVIKKDKKGKLIFKLAKDFNNIANIDKLSKAIDKADEQGFMCCKFLLEINGANTQFLEERIAKKDKLGAFCRELALRPGANLEMLTDRIIEMKKKSSWVIIGFAEALDKVEKTQKYEEKLLYYLIDNNYSSKDIYDYLTTVSQLGAISTQRAVDKIKSDEAATEIINNIKMHTLLKVYI